MIAYVFIDDSVRIIILMTAYVLRLMTAYVLRTFFKDWKLVSTIRFTYFCCKIFTSFLQSLEFVLTYLTSFLQKPRVLAFAFCAHQIRTHLMTAYAVPNNWIKQK